MWILLYLILTQRSLKLSSFYIFFLLIAVLIGWFSQFYLPNHFSITLIPCRVCVCVCVCVCNIYLSKFQLLYSVSLVLSYIFFLCWYFSLNLSIHFLSLVNLLWSFIWTLYQGKHLSKDHFTRVCSGVLFCSFIWNLFLCLLIMFDFWFLFLWIRQNIYLSLSFKSIFVWVHLLCLLLTTGDFGRLIPARVSAGLG